MSDETKSDILRRKTDHIDIVLARDVGFSPLTTGFDAIQFVHEAAPEISLADVDLSTSFLGKRVAAPYLISSMTGGPARAATINGHLAEAAEALGIALAVGSQRIALESDEVAGLGRAVRRLAPSAPILGNLGAAQIRGPQRVDTAKRAMEMIDADGLFIHLNPLQEAVQHGGDTDWRGVLDGIESLIAAGLPIAVKEVGFGISGSLAQRLYNIGVKIIDVAGAGGTNWARVEAARGNADQPSSYGEDFAQWGIPTVRALMEARAAAPAATVIASGGIRTGVDAAKAIRLGADLVGQAAGTLAAATESAEAVVRHFRRMIETLRIAAFCTGSTSLQALKAAPIIGTGPPTPSS